MLPFGAAGEERGDVVVHLPVREAPAEPESEAVRRRLALLETVSLFFTLPDHSLRKLARRLQPVKARKDEILIGLGEKSRRLYVIEEGLCQLSSSGGPLLVVGERDVVGASSVLHDEPSPVVVRALQNCRLLALEGADLLEVAPRDSELHEALRRVSSQRRTRLQEMARRSTAVSPAGTTVISVYSPKGGSGKTTIAVSLATTLAHQERGGVLLFDLALPYNHAALMTRLQPTGCLARLARLGGPAFAAALEGCVLFHPSGVMVLPTALLPEEADLVTPEVVLRALDALRRSFRYVVFDLGVGLSETAVAALEQTDHLLAVTTPELSSLSDLGRLYPMLERVFRLPLTRVHLVVNHRSPNSVVGEREVKGILRREVAAEIRYDGMRPEESAVRGQLLVGDPRSAVARASVELVRRIKKAEATSA
jgi:MinD-like ATPase involved in chromosome partitioning or flagellar assembly